MLARGQITQKPADRAQRVRISTEREDGKPRSIGNGVAGLTDRAQDGSASLRQCGHSLSRALQPLLATQVLQNVVATTGLNNAVKQVFRLLLLVL